jgi:hypothetical protein
MQKLAVALEKRPVRGVLHKCMLEQERGFWQRAAPENQAGIDKLIQGGAQRAIIVICHRRDQLVRELPTNGCADLRNIPGDRDPDGQAATSERREAWQEQQALDAAPRRQELRRPARLLRLPGPPSSVLPQTADTVGAVNDLRHDFVGKGIVLCHVCDQRRGHAAIESAQGDGRHMRLTDPQRLEVGTEGDYQKHRQACYAFDSYVQQLT